MPLLSVSHLTKSFGGIRAVNDLSIEVGEREIFGLIGPNGSGKSVTINCIAGVYRPDSGNISFDSKEITGYMPHKVAQAGINRTYQSTRIYPNLTVLEHLCFASQPKGLGSNTINFVKSLYQGTDGGQGNQIHDILKSSGLENTKDELAKNLSYGQQKALEFSSLLVVNPKPKMLLLDEPAAGLQAVEVERFMTQIADLRKQGITFLIVEHNLRFIMNICDRIAVLNYGSKIAEGKPDEIRKHEEVIAAYLGR